MPPTEEGSMSGTHITLRRAGGAAAIILTSLACAFGQTTGRTTPRLVGTSMYGHDLFELYCASCHGRDGRGGGPVAPALKTPPPDLTLSARRNGGTFPRVRVESFVTGDLTPTTPAHGSKGMPVWGPIFRSLDASDTASKVRIAN